MGLKKSQKILLLVALYASYLVTMGDSIIGPTVNMLYEMYPNNVGAVNFIVTGNFIINLIIIIMAGKLRDKFALKSLLIIGAVIAAIAAVGIALVNDIVILAALRAVYAVGVGFATALILVAFAEYFPDINERAKVIGYGQTVMMICGIFMPLIAGYLAAISVKSVYSMFWVMIVYPILIILFIPKASAQKADKVVQEEIKTKNNFKGFGSQFWVRLFSILLYSFEFCGLYFFLSVYIAEAGLGDASVYGWMCAISAAAAGVFGLIFGALYKKMSENLNIIGYIINAIAFVIMWLFPSNIILAYVAFSLICIANVAIMGGMTTLVPKIVPEKNVNTAITLVPAAGTALSAATAYLVTGIMGLMNTDSFLNIMVVFAIASIISVIFSIAIEMKFKMKEQI